MKDPITLKAWTRDVEPIIQWCDAHRGSRTDIHTAFNRRTKKNWARHQIKQWLNSNPEARSQPLYGTGKLLLEVAAEVMSEWDRIEKLQP